MSDNTQIATQQNVDPFFTFLAKQKNAVAQVLPKHLTPERMIRLTYAAATKSPKLRECSPGSIINCIILVSQLGLEPNTPQGHAYLIPYAGECTLVLGYKGLLELMRRSGLILEANAGVIYFDELDKDLFKANIEPPDINHAWTTLAIDRSAAAIVGAYCVVRTKDGGRYQVILTRDQIETRRKRGASGKGKSTPWDSDYEAMARKSAIRALLLGGMVPMSTELSDALAAEEPEEAVEVEAPTRAPTGHAALGIGDAPALQDSGEMKPEPETIDVKVETKPDLKAEPAKPTKPATRPAAKDMP